MTTETKGLPALIDAMEPEFKRALGAAVPSERFTRIARSAVAGNPDLAALDRPSLFKAIMQAAQDGLVLDGKEAAVIPFKGKAQYLPMVAGLVKKMRQHSGFANLSHGIIYENEVKSGAFEYVKGDEERLTHHPDLFGDRGEPIGAYAIVTTTEGQKFRAVLTKDEIDKRKNAGRAGGNGPWGSWAEEMWIKTAIKAVYKIAPNSGDQSGVLDQVFGRDEDPVIEAVKQAPITDKPQTRAAAAVKATVQEEPQGVEDAEIVPDGYDERFKPPM